MNETTDHNRLIELERADAARRAIEFMIRKLEDWGTNALYGKAVKAAVKLIREKWAYEFAETVTDIGRMPVVNVGHGAQEAPRVESGSHARSFDH
ncbi:MULTISPECIES: hypothetical protein [unclassified Bradyrhizobium]|uniref:hypothetical protein n=1 Tax=unclassified Bradyrhizobium TaxID=2631580 RepID=UPI00070F5C70|nr:MULTISPECIES: hypothetical protein [unclassified Bradyrhizobium]KQT21728.1 hypothetical protein ASG57_26760 [Bradyrhizobium sp. Leaf396]